jgi:phosphoribosyl 1,2-cyclic phosphate phosphodiesterase
MQLIFLGSSDDHGVPRAGCQCEVCENALQAGCRNHRTLPSVAVRYGPSYGERLVLVDVTPEFRLQAASQKLAPIDALLLTHAHEAHFLGLKLLLDAQRDAGQVLPLYAPQQVLDDARERLAWLWNEKSYRRLLQPESLDGSADLWGLQVNPLRLDHGLGGTAFGYILSDGDRRVAYVSDMLRATAEVRQALAGLDLLVLGASHYYEGIETWKRSVMDIIAALELIREVAPARAILTHLSHTVDYDEVTERLPASTLLAYDGLVVEV